MMMADILDKETGTINLKALSEYNGKTELENFKTITTILALKANIYNKPQKIRITFRGNPVGCEGDNR